MNQKPLRADAQRNRDRVLASAGSLFAEHGLSVSIEEIARHANVGIGTVYRHFPTKEALFGAIADDRIRHLAERAHELAASEDPGRAFLEFVESMIEQAMTNKAVLTAVSQADGPNPYITREAVDDLNRAEEMLLSRAQAAGGVREDLRVADLKAITHGCMAMASKLTDQARAVSIICDGLRPRPDENPRR